MRVLRDVADALMYAHEHGVVHRDVKPENILLSGRHALVADFGVAKALSEATGRSQLTTAGVALGTPAYMAPEQAMADPHVDHRADIYALGVVGYEMLSGEPPFTAPTPQQVLAAHVTSLPQPLSARRPAVPPLLADALMRCLEKRPADRWQSAGDFLAVLEMVTTPSGGSTPTETQPVAAVPPRRGARWALIAAGVAGAALLVAALVTGGRLGGRGADAPTVALLDRRQVTFTGRVRTPAISPDGKQLAFVTQRCGETACAYAVSVQDIGGSTTRTVLEGAASVIEIVWSPDRRHLLVTGTIERRWGSFLVSLLGGAPRRLAIGGGATFIAGGDSLALLSDWESEGVQWIRFADLAGRGRDSISIPSGDRRVVQVSAVPGRPWILALVFEKGELDYVMLDRAGTVLSQRDAPIGGMRLTQDAIWAFVAGAGGVVTILRTPFDPETGRIAERADSVHTGRLTSFSLTHDGSLAVMGEGAWQYGVYALDLADALAGRFREERRILSGSMDFYPQLSPDGNRILLTRPATSATGSLDFRMSVMPFPGGSETQLPLPAGTEIASWIDSVTIRVGTKTGEGLVFSRYDVRTGVRGDEYAIADTIVWDWTALPDSGYAWIPLGGQELRVHRGGATRIYPKPAWYEIVFGVGARGGRLALIGWNRGSADTMRITEIAPADGRETPWFTAFVDGGTFRLHSDGSILAVMYESEESAWVYHLTAPGQARRLGAIPRPISGIAISEDFSRALVATRDYLGDAWVARVVRK